MRPIPIPDDWLEPGARRIVFTAPDGDLLNDEIMPVEAAVTEPARIACLVELDPGDLDKLARMPRFWVVFYGGMFPFDVTLGEERDWFDVTKEGGDVLGHDAVDVIEPWATSAREVRWPYTWCRDAAGHVIVQGLDEQEQPRRWYRQEELMAEVRRLLRSAKEEHA